MTEIVFHVIEDKVDGGWVASAAAAGITTQADSIPELMEVIHDALRCHFDIEAEIPQVIHLAY